jgi:polysaccharide pyruvyl transferase WcaK-like protein
MPEILFLRSLGSVSRGCMAVQIGCINSIKASIPDAKITIWSIRAKEDAIWKQYDVTVVQHPWFKKRKSNLLTLFTGFWNILFDYFRCSVSRIFKKCDYDKFDIIIDTNMDGFNEREYGLPYLVQSLAFTLLARYIVKKPIILVPASIGPFKTHIAKFLTKFVLGKIDIVTVRGTVSEQYLSTLKFKSAPVYLSADLGFLLPPCSLENARELLSSNGISLNSKPLIGLSPSIELSAWSFPDIPDKKVKHKKYVELMAWVTDYLIENFHVQVCFVPHVMARVSDEKSDDNLATQQIVQQVTNKSSVVIFPDWYSPEELKGIIGSLDMLVSCRMHAAIASTSMSVPTVVLAYGAKYEDVIGGTMGQQDYIVHVENCFNKVLAELKNRIDRAWSNREIIRGDLVKRGETAREQAIFFGKLARQLIETKNPVK